jgi:hypothetical protein
MTAYIILYALQYTEKINILQYNVVHSEHLEPKIMCQIMTSNHPTFSLQTYLFLAGLRLT